MNKSFIMALASVALIAASASLAHAEPGWCKKRVSAKGHANIEEVSPERLACRRARSNWSAKIRASCDRSSPWWWRARGKSVKMDAGAGQRYCTVSAIPARKIF